MKVVSFCAPCSQNMKMFPCRGSVVKTIHFVYLVQCFISKALFKSRCGSKVCKSRLKRKPPHISEHQKNNHENWYKVRGWVHLRKRCVETNFIQWLPSLTILTDFDKFGAKRCKRSLVQFIYLNLTIKTSEEENLRRVRSKTSRGSIVMNNFQKLLDSNRCLFESQKLYSTM